MSDNNHFDSNLTEYTVSQISSALKRTVENAFERVRIHGEISGLKRAASGHVYLTLKDDKAVLDGVVWRGTASSLSFAPEDGLDVKWLLAAWASPDMRIGYHRTLYSTQNRNDNDPIQG